MEVPDNWQRLVDEFRQTDAPEITVILGPVDCGKTCLSHYVAQRLGREYNTALIDADLGQSDIGPPGVVGMAYLRGEEEVDQGGDVARFIGNFAPAGVFLQTVVGVKKLVDLARAGGVERIVVDTDGFVSGQPAASLKTHLLELLKPASVVVLGQAVGCLATVASVFRYDPEVRIAEETVNEELITSKTQEDRRNFRCEKLAGYLRHARVYETRLDQVSITGFVPESCREDFLRRRLIGLNDYKRNMVAMGVCDAYNTETSTLTYAAPEHAQDEVTEIAFGRMCYWG